MPLSDEQKKYQVEYYAKNKERKKAATREWYQNNKDKRREYRAGRFEKDKVWKRDWDLQKRYGINAEVVDLTIEMQNNHCPICRRYFAKDDRRWHVDHCHTSGKVRGIICSNCNTLLGQAKENISTLKNAIAYLEGNS